MLADARADAQKDQVKSVSALSPVGALIGVVTGTEDDKLEMLSGDYIKHIDEKTAEIKATCGL